MINSRRLRPGCQPIASITGNSTGSSKSGAVGGANKAFNLDEMLGQRRHAGAGVIPNGDDIWGDTVNTASRLEGQCPPGGVLISDTTKRLLSENHSISGPYPVDIRGKGELTAWRVEGDPA